MCAAEQYSQFWGRGWIQFSRLLFIYIRKFKILGRRWRLKQILATKIKREELTAVIYPGRLLDDLPILLQLFVVSVLKSILKEQISTLHKFLPSLKREHAQTLSSYGRFS